MKKKGIISKKQADELLRRYYDGLTSEHEERLLRIFLASDRADGDRYREHRAVMGLIVCGRRMYKEKRRGMRRPLWAAAVVAVLLSVGAGGYLMQNGNVCVAYINGQPCTDREVVMNRMQQTLYAATYRGDGMPSVEEQLQAVFDMDGLNGKDRME